MHETHCPLCYGSLEVREVAPCEDCGGDPTEIEHFRRGKHTYSEYEVFPGLKLVLCNFCDVDFGSYDPTFFGLPAQIHIGYGKMRQLRTLDSPTIEKDKYCPSCKRRLAFLRFVSQARDANAKAAADVRTDG